MPKRAKESVPEEEVIQVEEPVDREVAVVPMKDLEFEPILPPEPVPARPSVGQRVRGFFIFLFRLIMTLLIVAAIGVGLYYLLPIVYRNYILPVQENTVQLHELQDQQTQSEQTIASLQTRLTALEEEQAAQAESFTTLELRVSEIETEITARTESLAALEAMQTTLQTQNDETSAELERQINLLKGMELLSRARLFMYQSNFGLAEQDVQSARDLLVKLQPDAPETLAQNLSAVILRLELTLANLPNFPVAASDDLDIAWQILLGGLPPAEGVDATPTPPATLTPNPDVTPTPPEAVTPTATP